MATVSYEEGGESFKSYIQFPAVQQPYQYERKTSITLPFCSVTTSPSQQANNKVIIVFFFNPHDSQFNPCCVNLTREFLLWRSRLTFAPSWQRRAATGVVNLNLELLTSFTDTNGARTDAKATILTSINVSAAQRRGYSL